MGSHFFIAPLFFLLLFFLGTAYGGVLLSSLPRTLVVGASPKQAEVLKAGEDTITVTWGINSTLASGTDNEYKTVKVKLCYAPISQKDRTWRKVVDDLAKDKTCQFEIVERAYSSNKNQREESFNWKIERDIPTAIYFIRAYAFDSEGTQLGFGQTTNSQKTSKLFEIQGITGRHLSLEIAACCFSVFSVGSLFGFFVLEKRKTKRAS
ncbi:high-affinity nitrate transporter-activating protein 2.1-like [Tasmannia lanceolata]|uniref:high-affinity nitrate transporter-activating protein 2.1-like n=1 Tax=Tasmannia lanceolata TaxID=3420 RepID=UPI004062CC17